MLSDRQIAYGKGAFASSLFRYGNAIYCRMGYKIDAARPKILAAEEQCFNAAIFSSFFDLQVDTQLASYSRLSNSRELSKSRSVHFVSGFRRANTAPNRTNTESERKHTS